MNNTLLQAWNSNIKQQPQKKVAIHEKFHIKPRKTQIIEKNKPLQLNNFMKKTIFETLVEQVMSDEELNIVGVDTGAEDAAADIDTDETGSEESSDVTITLTADQVECLRAILDQIDGGADDLDVEDEMADESGAEEDALEGETEEEEFDAFATEELKLKKLVHLL